MTTRLDPIVSEFETQEQADAYARWFRKQVEVSLADPRPSTPHDEVMAMMAAIIDEAEHRQQGRA